MVLAGATHTVGVDLANSQREPEQHAWHAQAGSKVRAHRNHISYYYAMISTYKQRKILEMLLQLIKVCDVMGHPCVCAEGTLPSMLPLVAAKMRQEVHMLRLYMAHLRSTVQHSAAQHSTIQHSTHA